MKSYLLLTLTSVSVFTTVKSNPPQLIGKETAYCPILKCSTDDRMEIMDLCYKADLLETGVVLLKKCEKGKMCHGKLNRCTSDPYSSFDGKLPGSICEHDF